jgi:gliding motility-associated-like protein
MKDFYAKISARFSYLHRPSIGPIHTYISTHKSRFNIHSIKRQSDGCLYRCLGLFAILALSLQSTQLFGTGNSCPVIEAHASPDTVCPGQQVMLWATEGLSCGIAPVSCQGLPTIVEIASDTFVQALNPAGYPCPYGPHDASAHHQFLFRASELLPHIPAGSQISELGMGIAIPESGSTLNNFTIRMGCVPDTSLTGFINDSVLSIVYVANYLPHGGPTWNIHTLTSDYYWDGISNLAIDICFSGTAPGSINPQMSYSHTNFQSEWYSYTNNASGACSDTFASPVSAPATNERPNFIFGYCAPPAPNSFVTWTPSTGPDAVTTPHTDTTYAHPITQTSYQVTFTDTNGCVSSSSVVVYVDTAVKLNVIPDTFICNPSPVKVQALATIAAGSGINPASIVYTWTSHPSAGPLSGSSFTVTPTVTTTYICTISGTGICPLTDSVTITLGTGLPVPKTVDSISCAASSNGKIFINMAVGTPPYSYVWSPAGPNADSLVGLGPGTYYGTVTDAQGCIGHDTTRLIAPAALGLTFDSVNISCYNVNIGSVTALATGGRTPYHYLWNPAAANTNTLTGLAAGYYQLTVTDASGCVINGAVNVTQPPQLVSTASVTDLTGAGTRDGKITLTTTGGTAGYTYSSVPAIAGLPTATGLDTGTYVITVCDAHHCCTTVTAHVTGPPPIAITFTIANNTCAGQCIGTAAASATGGVPPYTYSWSSIPANTPLGTNSSVSNLCAGSYQIVVTDHNGLSVSKDTTISAPPAISIAIDSTPISCFGVNSGKLNAIVSGGTGVDNIAWTPGGTNPLSNLGPGMYVVNVTDANGCPAADTAYLGQPAQVTAAIISTDSVVCFGVSDGYANIKAAGGKPPYTYAWSGSTSVDSFAADLAAGTQAVTVTDHNGCTASVSFTIYQPTQLVLAMLDTFPAHCAGSNDGVAIATASGGIPPYRYIYDGVSTTGNVDSITGLTSGPHFVAIIDSRGCLTNNFIFTIDTQYVLHISMTADSVTCYGYSNGAAYVTVLNGSPAYTYQWHPASGATDSVTGLSAGTQAVLVTDKYGCTATGSVDVYQPGPIADAVSVIDPLCTGQPNGKIAITAGATTGPYTYSFNGNTYPIADSIFNLTAGTYQITITDGKGCTKADSAVLADPLPLSLPQPAVTGISCANEANGIIQANPTGGTPPYTYSWSPGGYTTAVQDSLGPADYTITVTDANGCTASVSDSLSAPPLITDSLLADSTSCPGSSDGSIQVVSATGGTPGTYIPYTYSINGGSYQIENNFYSLAAGTYQVDVKDSPGCVLYSSITIYQPSAVSVSIEPQDSMIALGSGIGLFPVIINLTTQTIHSYAWSPAVGLSCMDCPTPIASPYQNTQYYLTVNYGKNCNATDSNTIEVGHGPPVYIPNAFSPNGDGVNDYFSVFGTALQSVGMKVFDRWGEKVFDSGDSQWASWDGTYRGVLQPPGVYVYYVQLVYLNGTQETKQGSITLIR